MTSTLAHAHDAPVGGQSEGDGSAHGGNRTVHARIVRNVLVLGAAQPISWLLASAMAVLLPRYLGDVSLGKLSLAFSLVDLFSLLASLGVGPYLTKEVARTGPAAHGQVLNALLMRVPLALSVAALTAVSATLLPYEDLTRQLIYVYAVSIFCSALAGVLTGALYGMQAVLAVTVIGLVSKATLLGLVALSIFLDLGPLGVTAAFTLSSLVTVVLSLCAAWPHRILAGHLDVRAWPRLLRGGMPFFVWEASLLVYGRIDVILLSFLTTEAVIGWYSAAYRIISIPGFVPGILVMAIYPALARAASEGPGEFNAIARRSLQVVLLATVPIAFGIIALADKLLAFLGFPETFSRAVPLVAILALHVPLVGVDMIVGTALNALDKQRQWALTGVAAAVINPLLNLALIPLSDDLYANGAIGSAIATVLTELFMMGMGLGLLRGSVLDRSGLTVAIKCAVSAALMMVLVWTVRDLSLPLAVGIGAVTYLAASLAIGSVSAHDLRLARTFLTTWSGRRRAATA